MLEDGRYDAFVVWAEEEAAGGVLRIDLTITIGPHKGDVVSIRGRSGADPFDLTGTPCTLVVENGNPRLENEPGVR